MLRTGKPMRTRFIKGLLFCGGLLTTAGLFGACSLTGVTDIRVGECELGPEGDKRCQDALNPDAGFYDGCAAFECVQGDEYNRCQPIVGERCDNLDNDCDYLIDEPSENDSGRLTQTLELDEHELATGVTSASGASLADSESLSQLYVQLDSNAVQSLSLEGGSLSSVKQMAQKLPNKESEELFIELTEGCFRPGNAWVQTNCNLAESVVAAGDSVGFYASLTTTGCASGELHVGVIEPDNQSWFVDRGRGFRSPAYRGVTTRGSSCSDNGTAECSELKSKVAAGEGDTTMLGSVCGVSRLAIDALPQQALTAYLGRSATEDSCSSGDARKVFGLISFGDRGVRGAPFYWANPSGEGEPDVLGTSKSSAPPAVQALADKGFLVAHARAEGDIALTWVPSQELPTNNDGVSCPVVDGVSDCDSREGLETESIQGISELEILTAGSADGLALRVLPLGDEKLALAVSWVSGCASQNQAWELEAYVQILHLDLAGNSPTIVMSGPKLSLGKTRQIPISLASSTDFVAPGYESNGEKAPAEQRGGFYVLTRPSAPQAIRVSAFDGTRIAKNEVTEFGGSDETYLAPLRADSFLTQNRASGSLRQHTFSCAE